MRSADRKHKFYSGDAHRVNELVVRQRIVQLVLGGGAPWLRIPERSPLQLLRFKALHLARVLAAARGSTRCAEPQPLPTPSASARSFLVCLYAVWIASSTSSVEPRHVLLRLSQLRFTFTLYGSLSPAVEQLIPEVNAKRCRNCAPGMGHYSGSCTGRKPPHRGPRISVLPNGLQLPLSRLRHEPLGFPGAIRCSRNGIPSSGQVS